MKESVRIFRFIVIGTMNALIMALVVWLMMREMSFEGDYMVAIRGEKRSVSICGRSENE